MSILAITDTALYIADNVTSKRTSLRLERIHLNMKPQAIAWSPDNSSLYAAFIDAIYSFSSASSSPEGAIIYTAPPGQTLQPILLCRDTSTLIFAQSSNIHVLSLSTKPKLSNTLIGHSSSIISLSLSNDGTLLASASLSGTLCIHNLNQNSLTLLKGLSITSSAAKKLVCAFHSHSRTRLLVGYGRTCAIYDVTRPSNPMRTIKLSEMPANSFIIAVASSPFSKPLLAVAFNSGLIALVDLEKDRSLLKVLDVSMPITAMDFISDGTAIALGTETGKIILKGWRSTEEDDQIIILDETGSTERVTALSIQRRSKQLKHPFKSNETPPGPELSYPLVELKNTALFSRHIVSSSPAELNFSSSEMDWAKRALQPRLKPLKTDESENRLDMSKWPPDVELHEKEPLQNQPNSYLVPQSKTTLPIPTISSAGHVTPSVSSRTDSRLSHLDFRQRPKKKSSDGSLRARDAYQPTTVISSGNNQAAVEPQSKLCLTKLPSEPFQPIQLKHVASQKQTKRINRNRITRNKKEKQVGWTVNESNIHTTLPSTLTESSQGDETPAGETTSNLPAETPYIGDSANSVHALVQTIHEHRRELREDIKGLHLDVLRMGRAWKNELRLLMEKHDRDLNALTKENAQLKKENESLRQRL